MYNEYVNIMNIIGIILRILYRTRIETQEIIIHHLLLYTFGYLIWKKPDAFRSAHAIKILSP